MGPGLFAGTGGSIKNVSPSTPLWMPPKKKSTLGRAGPTFPREGQKKNGGKGNIDPTISGKEKSGRGDGLAGFMGGFCGGGTRELCCFCLAGPYRGAFG